MFVARLSADMAAATGHDLVTFAGPGCAPADYFARVEVEIVDGEPRATPVFAAFVVLTDADRALIAAGSGLRIEFWGAEVPWSLAPTIGPVGVDADGFVAC